MSVDPTVGVAQGSLGPALLPRGSADAPAMPVVRPFTLIGSRSSAHWRLMGPTISRSHAALIYSRGTLYIRDLASRSPVLINGHAVREAVLQEGDVLHIGTFSFEVQHPQSDLPGHLEPIASGALQAKDSQAPVPISARTLLIGRRRTADIVLSSKSVSNAHALVFSMKGAHYVRDLLSRTGTYVNGQHVKQQKLAPGDRIRVGETEFEYQSVDQPPNALELAVEDVPTIPIEPAVSPDDKSRVSDGLASSGSFSGSALQTSEPEITAEPQPRIPVAPPAPKPVTVELDPVIAAFKDDRVPLSARLRSGDALVGQGTATFSVHREGRQLLASPPLRVTAGAVAADLCLRELAPGSYVVQASYEPGNAADLFLTAQARNTLTITKAAAAISLQDLSQIFNGSPRPVAVSTEPPGLEGISITYAGSTAAPANAGTYPVVVRLNHPSYQAPDAIGTLVIAKAPQTIVFEPLPDRVYGQPPFELEARASSGLPVSFSASGAAKAQGDQISIVSAGEATITAHQEGDADFQPATLTRSFSVARALLVVRADDAQRGEGQPHPPFTGTVTGLQNGDRITAELATSADQLSLAGQYEITARVSDPDGRLTNYVVSYVPGTLTIIPAAHPMPPEPPTPPQPAVSASALPEIFAPPATIPNIPTPSGQTTEPAPDATIHVDGEAAAVSDSAAEPAPTLTPTQPSSQSVEFEWMPGCDQGSYLGAIPFRIQSPNSSPPAASAAERTTTVVRGSAAHPTASSSNGSASRPRGLRRVLSLFKLGKS